MNMILRTERFSLREFTETDTDINDLFRLDSDPDVMRLTIDGTTKSYATIKRGIRQITGYYAKHPGYGLWHATNNADAQFIGWFSLKHLGETDDIEIGYRLMKEYWGKGYATEGSKALLQYGFETLGLERIVAVANPENAASRRVIEKVGMRFEEYTRRYNNTVAYYSIDRQQYYRQRAA